MFLFFLFLSWSLFNNFFLFWSCGFYKFIGNSHTLGAEIAAVLIFSTGQSEYY